MDELPRNLLQLHRGVATNSVLGGGEGAGSNRDLFRIVNTNVI